MPKVWAGTTGMNNEAGLKCSSSFVALFQPYKNLDSLRSASPRYRNILMGLL